MSVPFIMVILFLLLAPLESLRLFRRTAEWQKAQVALDNAAIELGKRDRDLFRYVASANQVLAGLELLHHPLHLCARVPKTAPVCGPKDLALEAKIQTVRLETYRAASLSWTGNGVRALSQLGTYRVSASRTGRVPLRSVVCALCRRAVLWEVERPAATLSVFRARHPRVLESGVRLVGESLVKPSTWHFRLEKPR